MDTGNSKKQSNEAKPDDESKKERTLEEIPHHSTSFSSRELGSRRSIRAHYTEDDIMVCYDTYSLHTETNSVAPVTVSESISNRHAHRIRLRQREELNGIGLIRLYSRHWIGQCIAGFITGLIFFFIGIIVIFFLNELPKYIGAVFLILSFIPCCIAISRWRYAVLRSSHQNAQRRNEAAMIRSRRRHTEETERTPSFSDLPPSYQNLEFNSQEIESGLDPTYQTQAFASNDFTPPSYNEALKIKKQKNMLKTDTNQQRSEASSVSAEEECTSHHQLPLPHLHDLS